MNKLPPAAAGLLEHARDEDRAHEFDVERSLAALHATLPFAADVELADLTDASSELAGELGSGAADATLQALGKSALFAGKGLKLFLATVVVAGAIGGTALLGSEPARQASKPQAPQQTAPVLASATRRTAEERAHHVRDANEPSRRLSPRSSAERAPKELLAVSATRAAVKRVTARTADAPSSASLTNDSAAAVPREPAAASTEPGTKPEQMAAAPLAPAGPSELDLIDRALTSLRDRDGAQALKHLELHQRLHANGTFVTERRGLRVLALCSLGRTNEARTEQAAFLSRYPNAPIATRVRRACSRSEEGR